MEKKRKKDDDSILTKTGGCGYYYCNLSLLISVGGAYIPPARLRMMQAQITDKTRYVDFIYFKLIFSLYLSSVPYQRMAWEALKKSINGLINKVHSIT